MSAFANIRKSQLLTFSGDVPLTSQFEEHREVEGAASRFLSGFSHRWQVLQMFNNTKGPFGNKTR